MHCDGKFYTIFDDPEDLEFSGGLGHIKCKENRQAQYSSLLRYFGNRTWQNSRNNDIEAEPTQT